MLEIEKRFLCPNIKEVKQILEDSPQATFIKELMFKDVYYDFSDLILAKHDHWLRKRVVDGRSKFELKYKNHPTTIQSDNYFEIDDMDEILSKINTILSESGVQELEVGLLEDLLVDESESEMNKLYHQTSYQSNSDNKKQPENESTKLEEERNSLDRDDDGQVEGSSNSNCGYYPLMILADFITERSSFSLSQNEQEEKEKESTKKEEKEEEENPSSNFLIEHSIRCDVDEIDFGPSLIEFEVIPQNNAQKEFSQDEIQLLESSIEHVIESLFNNKNLLQPVPAASKLAFFLKSQVTTTDSPGCWLLEELKQIREN